MLILALDTTTPAGSVALNEVMRPLDPTQPLATQLPLALVTLLDEQKQRLERVDVFAVATGPGSFTGIRIGIATMQGLAFANAKPLIGVSAFEALATLANAARVATWIDAWRGEVYGAAYSVANAGTSGVALQEIEEPTVGPPERLLTSRAIASALAFIGDGAVKYRDLLPSDRVVVPTPLLAATVAQLARARAVAGEAPPPHAIRPLYVRRPDAELAKERARSPAR